MNAKAITPELPTEKKLPASSSPVGEPRSLDVIISIPLEAYHRIRDEWQRSEAERALHADLPADFLQQLMETAFFLSSQRLAGPRMCRLIVHTVARELQTPEDLIIRGGKSTNLVFPRHVAMWLCRQMSAVSLPELGRTFRRDHSSVLTAVRGIEKRRKTNAELARLLDDLEAKVKEQCAKS